MSKAPLNKGKRLLALSECADALCIIKEQWRRAGGLLAELSAGEPDSQDSADAARLAVGLQKVVEPLRVKIQRRHDELAREFVQEWQS